MMVDNQSTLEIVDTNGKKQQAEVVMVLELPQTKKRYIVYTLNEKRNDMVILYASSILSQNNEIILEDISDEEWLLLKNQMREIIHDRGGSQ